MRGFSVSKTVLLIIRLMYLILAQFDVSMSIFPLLKRHDGAARKCRLVADSVEKVFLG